MTRSVQKIRTTVYVGFKNVVVPNCSAATNDENSAMAFNSTAIVRKIWTVRSGVPVLFAADREHAEQGDASDDIDGLDAFAGIDGSRGYWNSGNRSDPDHGVLSKVLLDIEPLN